MLNGLKSWAHMVARAVHMRSLASAGALVYMLIVIFVCCHPTSSDWHDLVCRANVPVPPLCFAFEKEYSFLHFLHWIYGSSLSVVLTIIWSKRGNSWQLIDRFNIRCFNLRKSATFSFWQILFSNKISSARLAMSVFVMFEVISDKFSMFPMVCYSAESCTAVW